MIKLAGLAPIRLPSIGVKQSLHKLEQKVLTH